MVNHGFAMNQDMTLEFRVPFQVPGSHYDRAPGPQHLQQSRDSAHILPCSISRSDSARGCPKHPQEDPPQLSKPRGSMRNSSQKLPYDHNLLAIKTLLSACKPQRSSLFKMDFIGAVHSSTATSSNPRPE
jgi:hypothetical protein